MQGVAEMIDGIVWLIELGIALGCLVGAGASHGNACQADGNWLKGFAITLVPALYMALAGLLIAHLFGIWRP